MKKRARVLTQLGLLAREILWIPSRHHGKHNLRLDVAPAQANEGALAERNGQQMSNAHVLLELSRFPAVSSSRSLPYRPGPAGELCPRRPTARRVSSRQCAE